MALANRIKILGYHVNKMEVVNVTMDISTRLTKKGRAKFTWSFTAGALALALGSAAHANSMAASDATPTIQDFTQTSDNKNEWILSAKNYNNDRYVAETQIDPSTVKHLKPVWTFKIDDNGPVEAAPLIWHGIAYITSARDHVYAIDVKTGQAKWEFSDTPHVVAIAANRGVALLDGKVYIATVDGHLIALDAETGGKVFDVVDVDDPSNSFYTMAPLPYKNPTTGRVELLLGVSCGDWGGIGNISAFDATDGHRLWQFDTVPGPEQKGNATWNGNSWKHGGAAVWTAMAIDPSLDILYANAGNPGADFNGHGREGRNLYSNSLIALNISGRQPTLVWYYQFIPHDTHDWDPTMPPILFSSKIDGKTTPLVADADKAGNFWLLNASNGHLVNHFPISTQYNQNTEPSLQGNVACPYAYGGVEYNGGSYDPQTNMIYVPSTNECGFWKLNQNVVYIAGQGYFGGPFPKFVNTGACGVWNIACGVWKLGHNFVHLPGQAYIDDSFPKFIGEHTGQLNAISIDSGGIAWRYHDKLPMAGGALATSTGLVFTGLLNGDFDAFDAKTGNKLWSYNTGSPIIAPPIAFTEDGTDYVAVASGPAGMEQRPAMPMTNAGASLTLFAVK